MAKRLFKGVEMEEGLAGQSLSLRLQKKVAGKLGNRSVAKHLVSEPVAQLLDTAYAVLKFAYDKKRAEKAVKGVIKTVAKVSLLEREEQFSEADKAELNRFIARFRGLLLTVSSFIQVEYSYERAFLVDSLQDCETMLTRVLRRHLTAKSMDRLANTFAAFASPTFLDPFFTSPELAPQRHAVVVQLARLLD